MNQSKPSLDDLRIERKSPTEPGPRSWIGLVLILVLLLAGAAVWWLRGAAAIDVHTVAVREVTSGSNERTVLNASGYVTARRQATVSSKVTGKVAEVLIEEGLQVKQGQVLARLDILTQEAALRLAEAQLSESQRSLEENQVRLKQAQITQARQHRLLAGGATTQTDVDSADADAATYEARLKLGEQQVQVAERTLAQRRQDLDDTVIRAPFDGVVTTKDAQPGEMISPAAAGGGFTRTGICTLVDMKSLETDVDVN